MNTVVDPQPPADPVRLGKDDVASLFLFESLDPDQIEWLADRGWVVDVNSGDVIYREGEPAAVFVILLSGEVSLRRQVRDSELELVRTGHRGAYAGATQAYVSGIENPAYSNTMSATADSRLFLLAADSFGEVIRTWFPMAVHLLEGLFFGLRNSDAIVGQRERLIALGQLSAGLTHELNNPAAAAVRATATLRERVAGMRHKLSHLAGGSLDGSTLVSLTAMQEKAVDRVGTGPHLSPMETADAEDAIGEWLEDHGVVDGWDLAPTLVAAGLDADFLDSVAERLPAQHVEGGVRWLGYTVETELLMNEIDDATSRIAGLVSAAKQYSQLDRAPYQDIDVHDGIESTLIMLGRLIGGAVTVAREFDRSLPRIPAYPAELNQVWTNLIDNAVDAMGGTGTLTVRTYAENDCVVVEVADTGPGVPESIRRQIFEPFFTTKDVGQGTGLGLDISRRIVVERHGGDLRVQSEPGDTRFQVVLPLIQSAS